MSRAAIACASIVVASMACAAVAVVLRGIYDGCDPTDDAGVGIVLLLWAVACLGAAAFVVVAVRADRLLVSIVCWVLLVPMVLAGTFYVFVVVVTLADSAVC